jgi:2,4-dienoyl-CoA reductase-like NADH-dependent reductase (Old Yellow Enzyme family)
MQMCQVYERRVNRWMERGLCFPTAVTTVFAELCYEDYGCRPCERILHLPPTLGPWMCCRSLLKQEGNFDLIAPSPVPLGKGLQPGGGEVVVPRELTVAELREYAQLFSKAASNAIEAGFDGVEVHAANGYLLDQFLQTVSNERTNEYGGSIDNRVRFPLEVMKAIVESIGAERTAVRISP